MPAHSDLIDAEDLHYAKARLFTGSPTEIVPDFAGQILIDEYRRMWVGGSRSVGDLVQVAGNAGGSGGEVGASIIFGLGAPSETPPAVGVQYLDWATRDLYYAYHTNSPAGWIHSKILTQVILRPRNDLQVPDAEIGLEIYYFDPYIRSTYQLQNEPTNLIEPIKQFEAGELTNAFQSTRDGNLDHIIDLTELFNLYGIGSYVLCFTTPTPQTFGSKLGFLNSTMNVFPTGQNLVFSNVNCAPMYSGVFTPAFFNFTWIEEPLNLMLQLEPLSNIN
jgi:hypothetical protein